MTRYSKKNGKYHIAGSTYDKLIGTRAQVWHKTAYKTSGGLKKNNLLQNKAGRIVSKTKFISAKKEKRLVKHGYGTKKGHFGFVKLNKTSKRKMKGGKAYGNSFSPALVSSSGIDGQGITNYNGNLQIEAGMAGGKRSRKMRGGKGYGWLSSSGIDGQGITKYTNGASSIDVQLAAGQAGGRRRKRGGTTKPITFARGSPQSQALNAA